MTAEAVEQLFDEIRTAYFPRWDRQRRWSVRFGTPPGRPRVHGYCDLVARTIWVAFLDHHLMVHEIVHAVAGPCHGIRFQRRMIKAAEVAEKRGEDAVAVAIRKEVAQLEEVNGSPEPLYDRISEAVFDGVFGQRRRAPDYEALVSEMMLDNGLIPEEFNKKYPRARRVFEKAKKDAARQAELQAQFRARRLALE